MFPKNCQANAQAQTSAAARPLGSEEGIKNLRENLWANAGAIILKSSHHAVRGAAYTYAQRPVITNLSNGLFGIGNQVQENLSELTGVAQDERKVGRTGKINGDAIRTQRMFVKLQ